MGQAGRQLEDPVRSVMVGGRLRKPITKFVQTAMATMPIIVKKIVPNVLEKERLHAAPVTGKRW